MKPKEFLERFLPGGPWLLASIAFEGGGMRCREFSRDDDVDAWCAEENQKANLYLHVARIRGGLGKKASLGDVERVEWLHVDSDVEACPDGQDPEAWLQRERGRILRDLQTGGLKPTVIVFSGGGYQAYWKVKGGIEVGCDRGKAEEATRYNKDLVRVFAGSDSCQSVDHVMRLPGTVNWPDKKKLRKNPARTAAMADVVEWNDGVEYDVSMFGQGAADDRGPERVTVVVEGTAERVVDFRNDPRLKALPDAMRSLLVSGESADKEYGSRSEAQWAVSCALARAGVDDETHFAILTDGDLWVGAAVLTEKGGRERRGWKRYAVRQIEKAREACKAELDFIRDKDGAILPHLYENCRAAIKAAGVTLWHDEFSGTDYAEGLADEVVALTDQGEVALHSRVQKLLHVTFKFDFFRRGIVSVLYENKRHPVREYLEGLKWDGRPRVNRFLVDYAGADDCELNREVGRIFLIAAVRRIVEPGCKFDEMMILQGPQGIGKSTLLAALMPREGWFQGDAKLGAWGSKEVVETTQGRWICEIAELAAMKKADMEHVKTVLSVQVDKTRLSYERRAKEYPRQSVFAGTTNEERFLTDVTGNRRFWPVKTGSLQVDQARKDRDQLWAEAYSRREESIRLSESLWSEAAGRQESVRVVDPHEERLEKGLAGKVGFVKGMDLYEYLAVPMERRTMSLAKQVAGIMRKLGWDAHLSRVEGVKTRGYVRGARDEPPHLVLGPEGFTSTPAF